MVGGNCAGRSANFFVDTGSSISIIAESFVRFIDKFDKVVTCNLKLKSFSGNNIKTFGQIKLPVMIAGKSFEHTFVVSEFHEAEVLIGMDLMFDQGINIDARERLLYTNKGSSCFRSPPKPTERCLRVVCNETVIIPPLSGTHIQGKLLRPRKQRNDVYGQLEPHINTVVGTGIFTAHSLIRSEDNLVPVRVMNPTDKPVKICKRTWLGKMKPVEFGERVMRVTCETVSAVSSDCSGPEVNRLAEEEPLVKEWDRESLFKELKLDEMKISEEDKNDLQETVWEYRSIFSSGEHDLGCCNFFEAHLQLKDNYKPRWVPSRRIPFKQQPEMDRQIRGLLRSGVVEECTDHSNFNSPLFLVPSGNRSRLVADLRMVNLELQDDLMELPNLNHILDKVGDKNLYSTVDLSKSFHQVPYTKESRHVTAFMHNQKRYQFARMVMGLKSSSATFTRMVMRLINGLGISDALAFFIDDLLIFTRDVKSHIQILSVLFARLKLGNLKLTPRKCRFLREEVEYVGITLTKEGVRMNDSRIEHIKKLEPPSNRAELQSVLGMLNYSKKFCKGYSEIARPLYALLRKNKVFEWTEDCQIAFQRLRDMLISSPVLAFPEVSDPENSYEVTLDGSKHAFGGTLTQWIKGKRRVIAYFSRKVPDHKRIWPQTQIEFETLYQTLKHFSVYLRGVKNFTVITDCLPLLNITTIFSKMSSSVIRKLQELANYTFTMKHISGKSNQMCDGLSRYKYQVYGKSRENVASIGQSSTFNQEAALDGINRVTREHYRGKHPILVKRMQVPVTSETVVKDDCSNLIEESCSEVSVEERTIPEFLFDENSEDPSVVNIVQITPEIDNRHCNCSLARADAIEETPQVARAGDAVENVSAVIREAAVSSLERGVRFLNPTHEQIKQAQKGDDILNQVYGWVSKGEKPEVIQAGRLPQELLSYWKQFDLISIKEGILRRRWTEVRDPEGSRDLIIVPESLHESVLDMVHNQETAHAGVESCLEVCKRHFYWPKMGECFKLWIAACCKCAASKPPQAYNKAPLKHILFHSFNSAICFDHIVPEKVGATPRGYKYILTITDCWSNYVVAIPTKTQTAKESVSLIRRFWIDRFGQPRFMMADNHPGFRAKYFETIAQALDCKYIHGQPYVSRSTGRVERANRRLNTALRTSLPPGRYQDWDLWLSRIVFVLNSLRNRHTGYSSNRLVFGRELNTPLSLLAENRKDFELEPMKENEFDVEAYELYKNLKFITRKVRIQAERDFCYAQRYHDKNVKGPFFEEGEEAFVLINCPKHKFGPRWVGPYKISRKINDHLYCLDLPDGEKKVFNIGKLKRYVRNRFSKKLENSPTSTVPKTVSKEAELKAGSSDRFVDYSDSDSEEETDFQLRRASVVAKRREVHLERVPLEKDDAVSIYKRPSLNSTPRAINRPTHIELNSSNPSFRTVTPITYNSPTDGDVESVDNSTEFFTPARERSTARRSSSPVVSEETLNPDSAMSEDAEEHEIDTTGSLSPVNLRRQSPPREERRYNTRRAEERRQPDRLGFDKVRLVTDLMKLLNQ